MSDIKSLSDLIKTHYGFNTHPVLNGETDTAQIGVTKIANGNPRRIGLTITNLSPNSIYILPSNDVSASRGIYIGANGGSFALDWHIDLDLISWDWYAYAAVASAILVLENILV